MICILTTTFIIAQYYAITSSKKDQCMPELQERSFIERNLYCRLGGYILIAEAHATWWWVLT
jgi:hypothetical protein